jgi:hypothetical protein
MDLNFNKNEKIAIGVIGVILIVAVFLLVSTVMSIVSDVKATGDISYMYLTIKVVFSYILYQVIKAASSLSIKEVAGTN